MTETKDAAARDAVDGDREWFVVGRWQEYEGEGRANLVRVLAIAALFSVQLIQYHFLLDSPHSAEETRFHQAAIALAVAGAGFSFTVLLLIRRRIFPPALKYVSSGVDVVLITSLALIGAGPASPIVNAYFVAIALAGLRFSLPLVWFASLAAMLAFMFLVGAKDDVWFDEDHVIAPVHQMVMLVCLALTGIVTGQFIRRMRALADNYALRIRQQAAAKP